MHIENGEHVTLMKKLLLILACLALGCGQESARQRVVFTGTNSAELSDLKQAHGNASANVNGTANNKVLGEGSIPPAAQSFHHRGRAEGAAGRYDAALELFSKAAQAAPNWSYPVYDIAYTYLLKGDFTNALAKYREVDAREPGGFFTTKTAIWTLEREESGTFPRGTCAALALLDWAKTPAERKSRIDELAAKAPKYPPVLKEKAFVTEDLTQRLKLLDEALTLNPDLETYGVLMLNRAVVFQAQGRNDEAKSLLNGLLSTTNTTSTKALAREVLKTL